MKRLAAPTTRAAVAASLSASLVASLVTSLLTGCTGFEHISRNYVPLQPQVVTIGCNEPYEVYDNRQRRRMLIVSNGLREFAGCELNTATVLSDSGASRAERFRSAARTYLDETVREDCKITGETVFTDLQTEFLYACTAPIEPRTAKVPRLPGRRQVN